MGRLAQECEFPSGLWGRPAPARPGRTPCTSLSRSTATRPPRARTRRRLGSKARKPTVCSVLAKRDLVTRASFVTFCSADLSPLVQRSASSLLPLLSKFGKRGTRLYPVLFRGPFDCSGHLPIPCGIRNQLVCSHREEGGVLMGRHPICRSVRGVSPWQRHGRGSLVRSSTLS